MTMMTMIEVVDDRTVYLLSAGRRAVNLEIGPSACNQSALYLKNFAPSPIFRQFICYWAIKSTTFIRESDAVDLWQSNMEYCSKNSHQVFCFFLFALWWAVAFSWAWILPIVEFVQFYNLPNLHRVWDGQTVSAEKCSDSGGKTFLGPIWNLSDL